MIEKGLYITGSLSNYGYKTKNFKFHQSKMSVEGKKYLGFTKNENVCIYRHMKIKKVLSPFYHKK